MRKEVQNGAVDLFWAVAYCGKLDPGCAFRAHIVFENQADELSSWSTELNKIMETRHAVKLLWSVGEPMPKVDIECGRIHRSKRGKAITEMVRVGDEEDSKG